MFERRSDIRAAARREAVEKSRRETQERIRSNLQAEGVIIPPEVDQRVFNLVNRKESRKKRWLRFFRR